MAWSGTLNEHEAFKQAGEQEIFKQACPPWELKIWEVTDESPDGRWYTTPSPQCLEVGAKLRIIFAPLDLPFRNNWPQNRDLFSILGIPTDFSLERTQNIAHSFGRRSYDGGHSSWFHFLCKNVVLEPAPADQSQGGPSEGAAAGGRRRTMVLANENHTWNRSGFFLRAGDDGSVTLACFGALSHVRRRLEAFARAGSTWEHVRSEPYVLFDLVLEGLFAEVDNTAWTVAHVFGGMEISLIELASLKPKIRSKERMSPPFSSLHNCSKYASFVTEAIESCLMVLESVAAQVEGDIIDNQSGSREEGEEGKEEEDAKEERKKTEEKEKNMRLLARRQLRERLDYRRSLFRSTQLRLASMHKRIDNMINLAFNLVTQQDSLRMIADSNVMKMIAAITMLFLPTAGVAAVSGSQLFVAERDDGGEWDVEATPLFWMTWYVAIPLTAAVLSLAWLWHWWVHADRGNVLRGRGRKAKTG